MNLALLLHLHGICSKMKKRHFMKGDKSFLAVVTDQWNTLLREEQH
jgi:hypothetical protein